jgi:hypothetical protein
VDFDDAFLRRLKEGDPAAYELFIENYEGPLFRFFVCDHRDLPPATASFPQTCSSVSKEPPRRIDS